MLVAMRTDNIISAKGFKAQYIRACGARIIVKDHGFLTPSSGYSINQHDEANCTWTLIAENPGKYNSTFVLCIFVFLFEDQPITFQISFFIICRGSRNNYFHAYGDRSTRTFHMGYHLRSLFLGLHPDIWGWKHRRAAFRKMVQQCHTTADYEHRKLTHAASICTLRVCWPLRR